MLLLVTGVTKSSVHLGCGFNSGTGVLTSWLLNPHLSVPMDGVVTLFVLILQNACWQTMVIHHVVKQHSSLVTNFFMKWNGIAPKVKT